jgi:hypothetical protein
MERRGIALGICVLLGVAAGAPTSFAQNCGVMNSASGTGNSGPPSISVTEASTSEVLELVRKRKSQMVVASAEADLGGDAVAEQSSSSAPAEEQPQQQAASPKPKKKKAAAASSEPVAADPMPQTAIIYGTWTQGFVDYERHKNLAPGQEENPTRKSISAGALAGMDWSKRSFASGVPKAIQAGVFAGYNDTNSEFSTTQFTDALGNTLQRTNSEQDIEGGFVGVYAGYLHGNFSADFTFKADFYDLTQTSDLRSTNCGFTGTQRGTADQNNYVVASNLYYRNPLSSSGWLEPTIGARLTITDYSNDRNAVDFTSNPPGDVIGTLGLDDGHALRLQAGVRFGEAGVAPSGWLWTYTLGAFIYSDVAVDGLASTAESGGIAAIVSPVDEGKVRVLGQFMTMIADGQGSSYSLTIETRGGEDVFGVGGMLGYRHEW